MKALSTKTGMSIQKNGVEAHFTSNLVFINLVPINDTQIKGSRVVLQISILANKAGRTTLTISGVDNFHKYILQTVTRKQQVNSYKETAGNRLNVKF